MSLFCPKERSETLASFIVSSWRKVIDKIDNKDNTELQPNEDPVLPTQVYDNLGFRMQSVDVPIEEVPETQENISSAIGLLPTAM
jgi:hypothetical protein